MFFDFDQGDYVVNPNNTDWGVGQVQSISNNIVTVNFTNAGKKAINANKIVLDKYNEKAE